MLAEACSLINSQCFFENQKHSGAWVGRWRFMHQSANGFGLDAAVLAIFCGCLLTTKINIKFKSVSLFFLMISLAAVFFSETRSAMLMIVIAFCAYWFFRLRLRSFFIAGVVVVSSLWGLGEIVGVGGIIEYLRIEQSLDQTSTGRFGAMLEAVQIISRSPIFGLGFGQADGSFPVKPSNLLYVMLPVEVGILGASGLFFILFIPLMGMIQLKLKSDSFDFVRSTTFIEKFSFLLYLAFLGWSLVEFDIFRVSASNQIFVFAWMATYFHILRIRLGK